MPDKEFNLLHEPWILVMKQDGTTDEVSILDAFRHAHEYRALAGELPTQDVAILRLLLAIMHAVFGRVDVEGKYKPLCNGTKNEALMRWRSLWELGHVPMKPLEAYLAKVEDRFWLFHPETPFYQVAQVNEKWTPNGAIKLNGIVSESENTYKLFCPCAGKSKSTLSYSEAARWLLNLHGYGDNSLKGKEEGQGGIKLGWLGGLGIVYACGDNLFETLLLNFVLLQNGCDELHNKENPVWEKQLSDKTRVEISRPDNLSELYTLQSRRVYLFREGKNIVSFKAQGGEFFDETNAFIEPMTIWKNKKDGIYIPDPHLQSKQIWRDFESIFVHNKSHKSPMIVDWISYLKNNQILDSVKYIKFRTPGIVYDSKKNSVVDIIDDTLRIHTYLLSEMSEVWIIRIVNEISVCDQLVYQLGILAKNIQLAAGAGKEDKQPGGAKSKAMTSGYDALDMPFRTWLESIDPSNSDNIDVKCEEWWNIAQAKIRNLGELLVAQVGARAFKEKAGQDGTERVIAVPEAYNNFMNKTASRDNLNSSQNTKKIKGGKK